MKALKKEWCALAVSLLVLALLVGFLTVLLTPKQHDYGSTWGHYLAEEESALDVLFFGSSLVYCNVAPGTLWQETGLTSYVLAGPEQTMPMTYYYVKEALKTQSPQVVFVEVTGVFYDRYTNFTKTNIGQMPWGRNRLEAAFKEAEPDLRGGLLFPLLFYHDRWSQVTADDVKIALFGYGPDLLAGYTPLDTYCETGGTVVRDDLTMDEENIRRNVAYLQKIRGRCLEAGAVPVFYVSPTLSRVEEQAMDGLLDTVSSWDGVCLLDCSEAFDAIGVDLPGDFYDPLHFNTSGAVKFTAWLGAWMEEELDLTPNGQADQALWQSRAEHIRSLAEQPMKPQ